MATAKKPKKYSRTAIEGLPTPAKGRVAYPDSGTPGLTVVVHASGKKSWVLTKRLPLALSQAYHKETLRECLGDALVLPPEQARNKARLILADLEGHLSQRLAPPPPSRLTLKELFDKAAETIWAGRPKAIKAHEESLNNNCKDWLGMPLDEITPAVFRAKFSQIGTTRKVTANRWRALMVTLFRLAQTDLDYPSNPALVTKKFPEQSRDRRLSQQETRRLLEGLKESPMHDFFTLALFSGARKANLLEAKWSEFNLAEGVWSIPGEKMKAGFSVRIPLVRELVALLKNRAASQPKGTPWLFPGSKPGQPLREPKRHWQKLCKEAGLDDLHLHDLRRSLASFMADTGASDSQIGSMLGHKSDSRGVVGVYSRPALEPVREAAQRAVDAMQAC